MRRHGRIRPCKHSQVDVDIGAECPGQSPRAFFKRIEVCSYGREQCGRYWRRQDETVEKEEGDDGC